MTEDNLIEQANKAAARIEAANAEMREMVKKQEALFAQQEAVRIMGGRSAAGASQAPQMTEEQKLKQEMSAFFKGTAVERAVR